MRKWLLFTKRVVTDLDELYFQKVCKQSTLNATERNHTRGGSCLYNLRKIRPIHSDCNFVKISFHDKIFAVYSK